MGFKGFWMGYFGFRAAPLGPVGPDLVEALFFGFNHSMVARSLPDAWSFATPAAAIAARSTAAAAGLRRVAPKIDEVADDVVDDLEAAVLGGPAGGLALFAVNRAVDVGPDPVARLWQAVTALRERRGDVHVGLLAAAGLDGLESHVLAAGHKGLPVATLRDNRGYDEADWNEAVGRLRVRGLVSGTGTLTADGRELRAGIEEATEARTPFDERTAAALDRLAGPAEAVLAAGLVPFPNPMGLPRDR